MDAVIAEEKPIEFVGVMLSLRHRQASHLEYLSDRDDLTISAALRQVIENAREKLVVSPTARGSLVRKHVSLHEENLAFVDRLAICWGLGRSDVVRRLIDAEMVVGRVP